MRHYARRVLDGVVEIVDREFDFVRAILPYDYRFTCNADQMDQAERICEALESPMVSQGICVIPDPGLEEQRREPGDALSAFTVMRDAFFPDKK